jgi:hypothetical protein
MLLSYESLQFRHRDGAIAIDIHVVESWTKVEIAAGFRMHYNAISVSIQRVKQIRVTRCGALIIRSLVRRGVAPRGSGGQKESRDKGSEQVSRYFKTIWHDVLPHSMIHGAFTFPILRPHRPTMNHADGLICAQSS